MTVWEVFVYDSGFAACWGEMGLWGLWKRGIALVNGPGICDGGYRNGTCRLYSEESEMTYFSSY